MIQGLRGIGEGCWNVTKSLVRYLQILGEKAAAWIEKKTRPKEKKNAE